MSLKKSIILHTCTDLILPAINDINSNIYVISGYELCSFRLLHNKSKRKKERRESLEDTVHYRFSVWLASSILCIGRKRPEQQSFNRRLKTDGTPAFFVVFF